MKFLDKVDFNIVLKAWCNTEFHRINKYFDSDKLGTDNFLDENVRGSSILNFRKPLIEYIPDDTEWWQVQLTEATLTKLYSIFSPDWHDSCLGFGLIKEYDVPLLTSTNDTTVNAIVLFGSRHGPYTILEGNHRIAAALAHKQLAINGQVFLGVSSSPCRWHRPYAFATNSHFISQIVASAKQFPANRMDSTSKSLFYQSQSNFFSITADDGYENTVNKLPQCLANHGIVGTFYIHGSRQITSRKVHCRLAKTEKILELIDCGQELGAHSFHHVSWPTLSVDECLQEVRKSFQFFAEFNIIPKSFAYPFGHVDETSFFIASNFFETAVIVGNYPVDSSPIPHLLPRIDLKPGFSVNDIISNLKASIIQQQPLWAIFVVHELSTKDLISLNRLVNSLLTKGWCGGSVSDIWHLLNER